MHHCIGLESHGPAYKPSVLEKSNFVEPLNILLHKTESSESFDCLDGVSTNETNSKEREEKTDFQW